MHTAFERSKRGQKVDRQAIDTLVAAAGRRAAAGKTTGFVYTSAVWVLGPTQGQATEDSRCGRTPLVAWRPEHETARPGCADGDGGIRASVVRPGIVYGGARGIVADLLKDALNGLRARGRRRPEPLAVRLRSGSG